MIAVTVLIVLLLIIYLMSPSIFNLVSSLDQDIFGRRQKLLNGSDNANVMRIDNGFGDEYETDEDNITMIDISKPVQNTTMPNKPKRKYKNGSNLMLMSVDDQMGNRDEPEYDYQQSNQ